MIKMDGISGSYSEKTIIHNLSLNIEKGTFFALLGPNGSGKTTLLHMLSGVHPIDEGHIWIERQQIQTYSPLEKARKFAVLAQQEQVAFDFNVEEIVALGRYPHQKGLFKLLRSYDYHKIKEAMQWTDVLRYRSVAFRQLSGGEKQRVLLAKVLAQEPDLLFLDEPTNHLDVHHTLHVLDLLKRWQKEKNLTIFAIMHDLNIASLYADQFALLKEGRIIEDGDVSLLKNVKHLQDVFQVEVTTRDHPGLAKPQLLVTPGRQEKLDVRNLLDIYHLHQDNRHIHIAFDRPLKTLSNGVWGEGFRWASHFCNFYVSKDYDCIDPVEDTRNWLAQFGIPEEQALGMMTAVKMDDMIWLLHKDESYTYMIMVTAGVGNAVDVAADTEPQQLQRMGTINTQLFIDGHLTDGAFVNAIMTATEGKTKALADLMVRDGQTLSIATGTSTDSLCIASTQRGEPTPYAGSGTLLGKSLGRLVYQATTQAIQRYWKD